jgi:hypothetical protein
LAISLNVYITQVQRLLHDSSQNFWSTSEITDYLNAARNKVASVTGCIRYLDTGVSLSANVEQYPFSGFTHAGQTIDVLGITVIWGNERIALRWMPWTEFTAFLRPWVQFQQVPFVWSKYGDTTVFVGPKPDQTYATEIDTIEAPNTLIDNTTVEQLIYPRTDPVPYYAAYLAKYKEQSYGEANIFLADFWRKVREGATSMQLRRIRDIYEREQA